MDDSSVTKVEKETVMSQRAYLLFYEKIKNNHQDDKKEETKQIVLEANEADKKEETKRQVQSGEKKKSFFEEIE